MQNKQQKPLYLAHAGPKLLGMPLLNKSSAFTEHERIAFNLDGLLPPRFETIEQQVERTFQQYQELSSDMERHIFLRDIQDNNETLFHRLVAQHIDLMMPIIYTPTVGEACERFSDIYRSARGLFIAHHQKDRIDAILQNATKRNVKVIVITDGERVLGLGDQGVGGMGIPIGKLSLYTVCGGISPAYTLPVMLDVGTNNQTLLDDPMYMGCRHPRIDQSQYNAFLDAFMQAARRRWPDALIQFEDFAQHNAMPLLERYRNDFCCFNDDIQGTAAVAVATMLAACRAKNVDITQQRAMFVGGGSAGCGIAEQWVERLVAQGLTDEQARQRVYVIDKDGLLTHDTPNMRPFQARLARVSPPQALAQHPNASLTDLIHIIKPDMLIGVSGQAGLFSQMVIEAMYAHCKQPVVLPLSNPSRLAEATPSDILHWTNGNALVATGSPFDNVILEGVEHTISQSNNSYVFPAIGLAVVSCGATRVTNAMLMSASNALAESSPLVLTGKGGLLPPLSDIQSISQKIALSIAIAAVEDGVAPVQTEQELTQKIQKTFWRAHYRSYERIAS
ncbi:NAD-dependent malic enzyme [Alteromonas sp. KUL42]|uniref:NAD-dependent malic enzyme n=1 Tax=Alteromonas sp. KUL42 TaxID=2480797 RepID=UPI0010362122|nr:NAD-dependent malic enzyme [Alteromonas sp. KUL42]TAP34075.1 NAD-dependent malic enzyme [Alteromonas sp. KUL42]GEA08145.1 NAD-dependent malic enzyme [Alteromonas sp. KUL42]